MPPNMSCVNTQLMRRERRCFTGIVCLYKQKAIYPVMCVKESDIDRD